MAALGANLNNARVRGVIYQILVVGGVVALGAYLVSNTLGNLASRGIATGFGFLGREAGFDISESLFSYTAADTYLRAFWVGLANTLKVSFLGIIFASLLGLIVGLARLSHNWLVAKVATVFVEGIRNIPLLLQLFVCYAIFTAFPASREAFNPIEGVFLSNRGLRLPSIVWNDGLWLIVGAVSVAVILIFALAVWAHRRQEKTGKIFPILSSSLALLFGLPAVTYIGAGLDVIVDMPELTGFNFEGGISVSPEFAALLVGLTIYTASFIAEIVRSGILSVPHGQTEAALALGLKRSFVLKLVILPQALRVMIPPMTSQYLNLTKNSSLAVAIGYPDMVSIANTSANQTGQAVEAVALAMVVFLVISLSISTFMNWYNKKVALVTR